MLWFSPLLESEHQAAQEAPGALLDSTAPAPLRLRRWNGQQWVSARVLRWAGSEWEQTPLPIAALPGGAGWRRFVNPLLAIEISGSPLRINNQPVAVLGAIGARPPGRLAIAGQNVLISGQQIII